MKLKHLMIALLSMALCSCSVERARKQPINITMNLEMSFDDKSLLVTMRSSDSRIWCLSGAQGDLNFVDNLIINGDRYDYNSNTGNYGAIEIHDVNTYYGIYVVSNVDSMTLPIYLNNASDSREIRSLEFDIQLFDCGQWARGTPSFIIKHVSFRRDQSAQ